MVPTIYRERGIRFAFASNNCIEPAHVHAHAIANRSEAKFWLEPEVELDANHGLNQSQIRIARRVVDERRDDFLDAWREFCPPPRTG
jgi:hypothetical protein